MLTSTEVLNILITSLGMMYPMEIVLWILHWAVEIPVAMRLVFSFLIQYM